MADYTITWAGQDVTSTVQFYRDDKSSLHSRYNTTNTPATSSNSVTPQPLVYSSTLGQGAGSGSGHSGRSSQLTFYTTMGPAASALGAGTPINTNPYQVSNYKSTILADTPWGYWRLGDAVGSGTAADTSGNGRTGTVTAGVTFGQTSLLDGDGNTSASFNGSGDIALPTTGLPTGAQPWSLEALVNFSVSPSSGGRGTIVGFGTYTNDSMATLQFYNTGSYLQFILSCYGADIGSGAVSLNTLYHVVGTYDGSTTRLYVNGSLAASGTFTLTLANAFASIGSGNTPPADYLAGQADEVAIYSYALSASQVSAHYTAATTTQTVTPARQLVRQGEVIVYDPYGNKLFGGYAGKLSDATIGTQTYTQVMCYDYWQALARITINEILDGITDVAAIQYLLSTYAPWVDQSQLLNFTGGTLTGRVWRNKTLQWALQTIADMTGRQIYINPRRQIIYVSPTAANVAPFSLSDTPDFRTSYPHAVDEFSVDDTSIINRVIFYGGKKPTPDFAQDISTQANGSNKVFMLAYYPRKSSNGKVQVTVGGVQQVVGYVLGTGAANELKSQGGTADVLIDADARTVTFDVAPASGASVICTYRYQIPLIIQVTNQDSYNFYGAWYDGTISDETVVDSATAVQRCRVVLLEQAYGYTTLKLTCYQPGLAAGMQIGVVNRVRGINDTYIIQEVTAAPLGPGVWEYALTLGAWNWNLVDVLMQLAQRTNGSDLSQQEQVTPTKVSVQTTASSTIGVTVIPATRAMAQYWPGANGVGNMYPGLSSV